MKCSNCGEDGISLYFKGVVLFGVSVECSRCHMSLSLSGPWQGLSYFFASLAIIIVAYISDTGSTLIVSISAFLGLLFCWLLATAMPLSLDKDSAYSIKLKRKLRNARKGKS